MTNRIWARMADSVVAELISLPESFNPGINIFSSDLVFLDVTSVTGIAVGWTESNGSFAAPPAHLSASSAADLLAYASQMQNKTLAQIWSFDVGTKGTPLKLTTKLDAAGQNAMMKLSLWGMMNATTPGAMEPYSNIDYTTATISAAQATALSTKAGAIVSQSYAVLNGLADGIQSVSPTITTTAQIDAAGWPKP